jgi:CheY-like chemotaxis protein
MGGRARVAVVEDDGDIRDLVVQLLVDLGFESVGYPDGRAALAALRGAPQLPSVILLDLEMPVMDGWQFRAAQLADPALARIPVVITSGSNTSGIEADAVLPKPYETSKLCEVVARLSLRAAAAA